MPYVTSIERLAREEGLQEGLEKGIEKGIEKGRQQGVAEGLQIAIRKLLEFKFKKVPAKHIRKLHSVREVGRLSALLQAANDAETLDKVLSLL
jgi:flagellar biosynthesis/type III secretory pathway protein FliH